MLNLLDRIGNLNPQLLRELKGRLNWRSVLIVVGLSILAQMLLLLSFYSQLPTPENYSSSTYCSYIEHGKIVPYCYNPISFKSILTNWSRWWQDIAHSLNLGIPFLSMVPGSFFLLSDWQNEERKGTLDFVRLSPRSASSILLGKILGVPILIYGAIASAIPFHVFANLKAGHSLSFFLSFYGMLAAGSFLIFSFTLLFGFFSKSILKRSAQALGVTIAYVLFVAVIFVPGYLIWNTETVWKSLGALPVWEYLTSSTSFWAWFGLPISQNVAIAHLFAIINIAILSGWIWQGLTRCFHQPNATILRKRQSYALVFYLQLLILGLDVQNLNPNVGNYLRYFGVIFLPILLNLPIFLMLIAVLSPQRQAVMDWARYRRSQSPRSSLLKDLLVHDHSPAGLAIALNLAIAGLLWLIVFSFTDLWTQDSKPRTIMMILLSLVVIGLYASIVQWIVIQKTRKRNFIAVVAIALLSLVPPAIAALLWLSGLISTTLRNGVILASPFLWMLEQNSLTFPLAWFAVFGQLTVIAAINGLIARQVRQIGASEMKTDLVPRLKPHV